MIARCAFNRAWRLALSLPLVCVAASLMGQEPGPNTETNSLGMWLVPIPRGRFDMGMPYKWPGEDQCAPDNPMTGKDEHRACIDALSIPHWFTPGGIGHPRIRVTIDYEFEMGAFEVTQGQWFALMGDNPSMFKGIRDDDESSNYPVENFVGDAMIAFIRALNRKEGTDSYRLPTEAEWEYAELAGIEEPTAAALYLKAGTEYGWFQDNAAISGKVRTHEVAQKKPNPWGLYDMLGNVSEAVWDHYRPSYDGHPTDGTPVFPPASNGLQTWGFPIRGGNYSDYVVAPPGTWAIAHLLARSDMGIPSECVGFRVVRSKDPRDPNRKLFREFARQFISRTPGY